MIKTPFLLILAVQQTTYNAFPAFTRDDLSSENKNNTFTPTKVFEYLKQFGYLEQGSPNSEALFTEVAVKNALRSLQSYGGIRPTGEVDEKTIELLSRSRCGNTDTERKPPRSKRFIIGGKGWKKRTISYYLSNWTPKLGSEQFVKQELRRAFQTWAPYSRLNFIESADYYKSDIRVAFGRYSHGDYYPFDGPGIVLAHAYYPYEFGDYGGDIHFDEDENWSTNATENSGLDFFTVAVHEIGHSLGLAHSPTQESIMYPFYKGPERDFGLGYDDILAMYQQYITTPFLEGGLEDNHTTDEEDGDKDKEDKEDNEEDEKDNEEEKEEKDKDKEKDKNDDKDEQDDEFEQDDEEDTVLFDDEYLADEGDFYNDGFVTTTTKTEMTTALTAAANSPTTVVTKETSTQTYVGDYENVDDHIRRNRPKTEEDICASAVFDSVSRIRNELFVFKDEFMWRFSDRGRLRSGYPAPFRQMFDFPETVDHIDAVLERPEDGMLVFFSSGQFWLSDGNFFLGASQPLSVLGLPSSLSRVDAAFTWGKNKKIYIFSNNQYWRLNSEMRTEAGYPKDISAWRGVPSNLDSVFTWTDGVTYFLNGGYFWRFDDNNVITDTEIPLNINKYWFGC